MGGLKWGFREMGSSVCSVVSVFTRPSLTPGPSSQRRR